MKTTRIDTITNIREIPQPNFFIQYLGDDHSTLAAVRGMPYNPMYCGISPWEIPILEDGEFLAIAQYRLEQEGVINYLSSFVYIVRHIIQEYIPQHLTRSDQELENLPIYILTMGLDPRNWILNVHQEVQENPKDSIAIIIRSLRKTQFIHPPEPEDEE